MEKRFFCRFRSLVTLLLLSGFNAAWAQPVITSQPVSQINIPKGDQADFSVTATDTDGLPLKYQWRLNGVNVSGATKSAFSLKGTSAASGGIYTVGVADGKFAVESSPALLTFAATVVTTNNNFANRPSLTQFTNNYVRSINTSATKESGEPNHAGNAGGRSVWFKWLPPGTGVITITTAGSTFNTLLAVYTGTSVGELTRVPSAVSDDGRGTGHTSKVQFNGNDKTEYQIAVDGYNGAAGQILLSWSQEVTGDALPTITNMPAASVTTSSNGTAQLNVLATRGATVAWFLNGVASSNGKGNTLTLNSVNDTNIGDYTARITSDGGHTTITIPSHIQANVHDDGSTDTSALALDRFTDAALVVSQGVGSNPKGASGDSRGYTTSQIFSTVGGTKEPGEPNHCGQLGGASIWFSYTPPTNGLIQVNTDGSTFNTILAVYTGTGADFASLKSVDCSFTDDYVNDGQPRVSFEADKSTTYYIVVDGLNGATGAAHLNINNGAPVALTGSPVNQSVKTGSNATFTVAASGAIPRTFQWRYAGVDIGKATNSSLTVTNVQPAKTGVYTVFVSNIVSSTSADASLSLLVAPAIVTDVTNQTVVSGSSVTLVCGASGTAPLAYQWRTGATMTNIIGATTSALNFNPVQTANAASYRCVITNAAGAITSSIAVLTVNVAPSITSDPTNKTVLVGASAVFACQATGTAPLAYQWSTNGVTVAGATTTSYTLATAQLSNAGSYVCVITNIAGPATSATAILTVNAAPAFTLNPTNQTIIAGATVSLVAAASGSPTPTFQWRTGSSATNIIGATSATLVLNNVQSTNANSYVCVASNIAGVVTSTVAVLTVNIPPTITNNPSSQTVIASSNVSFFCQASGTAPLSYQWQTGTPATNISGATTTALTLNNAQTNNANNYICVVTNVAGVVTSSVATLIVNVPASITANPTTQTVNAGATVVFLCGASGTGPLTYQWRGGSGTGTNISGAIASSLTLASVTAASAGSYRCVVTNVANAVTSQVATLTVNLPPAITSDPTNLTVILGADAAFNCSASGTGPLSYQWRMGTTNLNGSTNSTLILAGTKTTSAGSYNCVVSNLAGTATSASATLTVNYAPVISTQPTNHTVTASSTAQLTVVASASPSPSYQWKFNGTNLAALGSLLRIINFQSTNEGSYQVVVSNALGSVTSDVAVMLLDGPIRLLSSSFTSGTVQLQMVGPSGSNFVFEESSDLITWLPVQTNVASNGVVIFTDNAPPKTNCYYRGRMQ